MSMEQALSVLNSLEREGLISKYAIGGAIAATFYLEPVITYDLDVFISVPMPPGGLIVLTPIYDSLKAKGYRPEREHIMISGIAVQLLPAYNPLVEEALHEAREIGLGTISTRVLGPEHLMAIMLQTGRNKDHTRLVQMLEQADFDRCLFDAVLERHELKEPWNDFRQRYGILRGDS